MENYKSPVRFLTGLFESIGEPSGEGVQLPNEDADGRRTAG